VTSASTLLILVWTVCVIPVYVQWHLSKVTGSWGALPGWVMLVEYGSLAIAAAVLAMRWTKHPAQQCTHEVDRVPPTKDFMNL
jgi:hypothetical protein